MNTPSALRNLHRSIALCALVLSFFLACHLTNEAKTEQTFSLPNISGTLQGADSAVIVLKSADGKIIDTLFADKVAGASFTDLVAKNYKGGKVTVGIEGFKDGTLIVKVDKIYSGTSGQVDGTVVIIAGPVPGAKIDSVVIAPLASALRVSGAVLQMRATVHPETSSQAVVWRSLEPAIAEITLQGALSGKDSGSAHIVATSVADPRVSDTLIVAVLSPVKVESIAFDRAILDLYAEGASEALKINVLPDGANPSVSITSADSTIVTVQDGKAKGVKAGETQIFATSLEDMSKKATLKVVVHAKPLAPVDSVTVTPDTLRLYTGGESKSLLASIYPKTHDARFGWRSAANGVATVDGTGKVSPTGAGRAYVRAQSLVDSTKADSSLVLVKTDVPRILVGRLDTTVSIGATVLFTPTVEQEYGSLVEVKWDLDDSASWDETATTFRPVSRTYPAAREYNVRFYAKDSEGNDTTVVKKVKVVNGPVILFKSPLDGSYANVNPIPVTWSVDGTEQTANETLKPGANTITKTAKNAAGETFSASITVHYDTEQPTKPIVKGPSGPIRTLRPAWSWEGSGGGNGTFRWRLDIDNLTTGSTQTTDTALTPGFDLTTGPHTLFVQERDAAGNWSQSGSFQVRIDTTGPTSPVVSAVTPTPTRNQRPTWSWTGAASEATSTYRYKLDNNDFRTGAITTSALQFTPEAGSELLEGPHILFVQHADSAGNWSASGSAIIRIDLTSPAAPKVTPPASPTNDRTPSFTFIPQGGGNGTYRVKFNDRNLGTGAIEVNSAGYTPTDSLAPGKWVLHVQERDTAGNWSASDSGTVTIDLTVPTAPTVNAPDGTPTIDQTPRWSWKQTAGGTGVFRFRFNNPNLDGQPETTDTQYVHGTDLPEGTYFVYVQQKNTAGTWSGNGSKSIRIDLTKPTAPTVTPAQSSPTMERRPTWNWTHTEPGVGYYRYSLDNAAFRDTTSTSFRPATNLSEGTHTVRIQERDSAGNWSDNGSAGVTIDITGPAAPTFNMTTPRSPVATQRPTWTWSTGGGGFGNRYRISLDNAAFQDHTGTSFQPGSNLADGAHTLRLQELDEAGNPSGTVNRTIVTVTRGYVGKANITGGPVSSISMMPKGPDTAFAAVTILETGLKVLRHVNGNWSDAGTGLFSGTCYEADVAVNSTGNAYVAYMDQGSGSKLGVMRLNGTTWQRVGNSDLISDGWDNKPQMHISPTDVPYVLYESGSQDKTPVVTRYTGSSWESLGQNGLQPSGMVDYALAFRKNGDPVMAFTTFIDYRVTVVKYSFGTRSWDTVGNIVALDKYTDALDLTVNENDEVYVGFIDQNGGNLPTVLKLNGTQWNSVGSSGMVAAEWGDFGLTFGSDQQPIVAFRNTSEVERLSVMAWVGSSWQTMGPSTLTSDKASMIVLRRNSNGVPYSAFQDQANSHGISILKTGFNP